MLMSLLWGCAPKSVLPEQYSNPLSVYVDEVQKEEEDQLLVVLGVENRSSSRIIIENVSIEVSGQSAAMNFHLHILEESTSQVRLVLPVDPALDQVRVSGMVSSLGKESVAVFDRTIDLVQFDHHH